MNWHWCHHLQWQHHPGMGVVFFWKLRQRASGTTHGMFAKPPSLPGVTNLHGKPPEHIVYINAKPIVSASGSEEFTPLSPAASPLLLVVLQEHGQRARPPSTKSAELGWYLGDGCKLFPFSSLSVTAETAWEKRFHFWSWPAVSFVLNYIYFCVSKSFQSEYQV